MTDYNIRHLDKKRRPIPREVKSAVWQFTSGLCWYCGFMTDPFNDMQFDDIVPVCRGGGIEIENLVIACAHCNRSKGAQLIEEWRENFKHADELDEEPWIDESGLFWFERDPKHAYWRINGIEVYHRVQRKRRDGTY